ncbi:YceI family protein [Corynebacterium aquilae]|uniref:Lipid/polyisoprenoid-binding YceI-like domain-containing protein n=1 Tax=Corynebacterium aquilae DSM 44791 TaxID=1431546 RepID=A0A1L7CFT6_9CORY|nr:YceI family protein [Corynebacterium aquilae]APT84731.1 hypothetical protein CAQU_06225 [Corynebacterium aquilae DSM 44791]
MRKPIVALTVIAIVVLALASVGPVAYKALTSTGLKTEGLSAEGALPASVDIDGDWHVVKGSGRNTTAVGYTFHEILPGQEKETSGTTHDVTGDVVVEGQTLTSGEVTVDLRNIKTDVEKRDINVRRNILHTDDFPTATFTLDQPVDVAQIPGDGSTGHVTLKGSLTLHGTTKPVTGEFDVLRTGERVVVAGDLPFNRTEFGVDSPDFVAAKIDENGVLNIRLALEKK